MTTITESLFGPSNRRRCVKGRTSYVDSIENFNPSEDTTFGEFNGIENSNDFNENVESETIEDIDDEPVTIDLSDFLKEIPLLTESTPENAVDSSAVSDCHSQFRVTNSLLAATKIDEDFILKNATTVETNTNSSNSASVCNISNSTFDSTSQPESKIDNKVTIKENSFIHNMKSPKKFIKPKSPLGFSNPLKKYKNFSKMKDFIKNNIKVFGKYPMVKCEKLDIENFMKKSDIKVSNWPLSHSKTLKKNIISPHKICTVNKKIRPKPISKTPKVFKPISFNKSIATTSSILVNALQSRINTDSLKPGVQKIPLFLNSLAENDSGSQFSMPHSVIKQSFIGNERIIRIVSPNFASQQHSNTLNIQNYKLPIVTSINKLNDNCKTFQIISPKPYTTPITPKVINNATLPNPVTEVVSPIKESYSVLETYNEKETSAIKPKFEEILSQTQMTNNKSITNLGTSMNKSLTKLSKTSEALTEKSTVCIKAAKDNSVRIVKNKSPVKLNSVFFNDSVKQINEPNKPVMETSALDVDDTKNITLEDTLEKTSSKSAALIVDAMTNAFKIQSRKSPKSKQSPSKVGRQPSLQNDNSRVGCQTYNSTLNDILFGFGTSDFTDDIYSTKTIENTNSETTESASNDILDNTTFETLIDSKFENPKPNKVISKYKYKRKDKSMKSFLDSDTLSASEGDSEEDNLSHKLSGKLNNCTIEAVSRNKIVKSLETNTLHECKSSSPSPEHKQDDAILSILEKNICPKSKNSSPKKAQNSIITTIPISSDIVSEATIMTEKQVTVIKDSVPKTSSSPARSRQRSLNVLKDSTSIPKQSPEKAETTIAQELPNFKSKSFTTSVVNKGRKRVSYLSSKIKTKRTFSSVKSLKNKKKSSRPADIIREIKTITGGKISNKRTLRGQRVTKKVLDSEADESEKASELESSEKLPRGRKNTKSTYKGKKHTAKKLKTLKVLFKKPNPNKNSCIKTHLNLNDNLLESLDESSELENNKSLPSTFREGNCEKMGTPNEDGFVDDTDAPLEKKQEGSEGGNCFDAKKELSSEQLDSPEFSPVCIETSCENTSAEVPSDNFTTSRTLNLLSKSEMVDQMPFTDLNENCTPVKIETQDSIANSPSDKSDPVQDELRIQSETDFDNKNNECEGEIQQQVTEQSMHNNAPEIMNNSNMKAQLNYFSTNNDQNDKGVDLGSTANFDIPVANNDCITHTNENYDTIIESKSDKFVENKTDKGNVEIIAEEFSIETINNSSNKLFVDSKDKSTVINVTEMLADESAAESVDKDSYDTKMLVIGHLEGDSNINDTDMLDKESIERDSNNDIGRLEAESLKKNINTDIFVKSVNDENSSFYKVVAENKKENSDSTNTYIPTSESNKEATNILVDETETVEENSDNVNNVIVSETVEENSDNVNNVVVSETVEENSDNVNNVIVSETVKDNSDNVNNLIVSETLEENAEKSDHVNNVIISETVEENSDNVNNVIVSETVEENSDNINNVIVPETLEESAEKSDNVNNVIISETVEENSDNVNNVIVSETVEENSNSKDFQLNSIKSSENITDANPDEIRKVSLENSVKKNLSVGNILENNRDILDNEVLDTNFAENVDTSVNTDLKESDLEPIKTRSSRRSCPKVKLTVTNKKSPKKNNSKQWYISERKSSTDSVCENVDSITKPIKTSKRSSRRWYISDRRKSTDSDVATTENSKLGEPIKSTESNALLDDSTVTDICTQQNSTDDKQCLETSASFSEISKTYSEDLSVPPVMIKEEPMDIVDMPDSEDLSSLSFNIKIEPETINSSPTAVKKPRNRKSSKKQSVKESKSDIVSPMTNIKIEDDVTKKKGKKSPVSTPATPRSRTKNYSPEAVALPFTLGWMRELVHRANDGKIGKKQSDVYYFTPEGTKLRSMPDISLYLSKHNITNVTTANFTFSKDCIYREPFEVERSAKTKSTIVVSVSTKKKSDSSTPVKTTPPKTPSLKKPEKASPSKKRRKSMPDCGSNTNNISETSNKASSNKKSDTVSPKKRFKSANSNTPDSKRDELKIENPLQITESTKKESKSSKSKTVQKTAKNVPPSKSPKKKSTPRKSNRRNSASLNDSQSDSNDIIPKKVKKISKTDTTKDSQIVSKHSAANDLTVYSSSDEQTPTVKKPIKVKFPFHKRHEILEHNPCTNRCQISNIRIATIQDPNIQCAVCLCLFHQCCIPIFPKGLQFVCKPCASQKLACYAALKEAPSSSAIPFLSDESDLPDLPEDLDISLLVPSLRMQVQSKLLSFPTFVSESNSDSDPSLQLASSHETPVFTSPTETVTSSLCLNEQTRPSLPMNPNTTFLIQTTAPSETVTSSLCLNQQTRPSLPMNTNTTFLIQTTTPTETVTSSLCLNEQTRPSLPMNPNTTFLIRTTTRPSNTHLHHSSPLLMPNPTNFSKQLSFPIGTRIPLDPTKTAFANPVVIRKLPQKGYVVCQPSNIQSRPRLPGYNPFSISTSQTSSHSLSTSVIESRLPHNSPILSSSSQISAQTLSKDQVPTHNIRGSIKNYSLLQTFLNAPRVNENKSSFSNTSNIVRLSSQMPNDKKESTSTEKINILSPPPSLIMNKLLRGYECLNLVFKKLNVYGLLRASQVSRSWKNLSTQDHLWKSVSFEGLRITDWDKCCISLQKHRTIHLDLCSIVLEDLDDPWKDFKTVMMKLTGIRELMFDKAPPALLSLIAVYMPQLLKLECLLTVVFTEPEIWLTPCEFELSCLRSLSKLRTLKIGSVGGIILKDDAKFMMPYLPNLRYLSLTGFKFHSAMNLSSLAEQQQLLTLELGDCSTVEPGIYELLGKLTKIKNLRLENGGSVDDTKLSEALLKMEKLEQLELMNYKISSSLPDALKHLMELIRFNVWPDNTDEGPLINYNSFQAVSSCKRLKYICWGIIAEGDSIPQILEMQDVKEINSKIEIPFKELFKKLVALFSDCRVELKCVPRSTWREFCSSRK